MALHSLLFLSSVQYKIIKSWCNVFFPYKTVQKTRNYISLKNCMFAKETGNISR